MALNSRQVKNLIEFMKKFEEKSELMECQNHIATMIRSKRWNMLPPFVQLLYKYLKISMDVCRLSWLSSSDTFQAEIEELIDGLFRNVPFQENALRLASLYRQLGTFFKVHDTLMLPLTTADTNLVSNAFMDYHHIKWATWRASGDPFSVKSLPKRKKVASKIILGVISPELASEHPLTYLVLPILCSMNPKEFSVVFFNTLTGSGVGLAERDKSWVRFINRNKNIRHIDLGIQMGLLHTPDDEFDLQDTLRDVNESIASEKCDIIMDLSLNVSGSYPPLLLQNRFRASQVVVTHAVAFAASSGCKCVDAFIADNIVVPELESGDYRERIANIPGTYFPGAMSSLFPHLNNRMELQHEGNSFILNSMDRIPKWVRLCKKDVWDGLQLGESSARSQVCIRGLQFVNGSEDNMKCLFRSEIVNGSQTLPRSCIVVTTRGHYDLPKHGHVIGLFNQPRKLSPEIWKVCIKILLADVDNILWMYVPADNNDAEAQRRNVIAALRSKGINPALQLRMADFASKETHVRRLQLVTVCIDCFPCNSHTTAIDIIIAGTLQVTGNFGKNLAGRVACSILSAMKMDALIGTDYDDMTKICLQILTNRSWRLRLQTAMRKRRQTVPTFSAQLVAFYWQDILKKIVEKDREGRRKAFTRTEQWTNDTYNYRTLAGGPPIEPSNDIQLMHRDIMAKINTINKEDYTGHPISLHETPDMDMTEKSTDYTDVDETMSFIGEEHQEGGRLEEPLNTSNSSQEEGYQLQIYPAVDYANVQEQLQNLDKSVSISQRAFALEIVATGVYDVQDAMLANLTRHRNANPDMYPSGHLLVTYFTTLLRQRFEKTKFFQLPPVQYLSEFFLSEKTAVFNRPQQYLHLLQYFRVNKEGKLWLCEDRDDDPFIQTLEKLKRYISYSNEMQEYTFTIGSQSSKYSKEVDNAMIKNSFTKCPFCPNADICTVAQICGHYNEVHKEAALKENRCNWCGKRFANINAWRKHQEACRAIIEQNTVWKGVEGFWSRPYDKSLRQALSSVDVFESLDAQIKKYINKKWNYSYGQIALTFSYIEKASEQVLDVFHNNLKLSSGTELLVLQYLILLSAHFMTYHMPMLASVDQKRLRRKATVNINDYLGGFKFLNDMQATRFCGMFTSEGSIIESKFGRHAQPVEGNVRIFGYSEPLHTIVEPPDADSCSVCGIRFPNDELGGLTKNIHKFVHTALMGKWNWPKFNHE